MLNDFSLHVYGVGKRVSIRAHACVCVCVCVLERYSMGISVNALRLLAALQHASATALDTDTQIQRATTPYTAIVYYDETCDERNTFSVESK